MGQEELFWALNRVAKFNKRINSNRTLSESVTESKNILESNDDDEIGKKEWQVERNREGKIAGTYGREEKGIEWDGEWHKAWGRKKIVRKY